MGIPAQCCWAFQPSGLVCLTAQWDSEYIGTSNIYQVMQRGIDCLHSPCKDLDSLFKVLHTRSIGKISQEFSGKKLSKIWISHNKLLAENSFHLRERWDGGTDNVKWRNAIVKGETAPSVLHAAMWRPFHLLVPLQCQGLNKFSAKPHHP